jgi:copper(I)-binding protein
VTRFSHRLFAASAGLATCGVILTGCGSGQISQVASQVAAVNGASASAENIALRNVHLQGVETGDNLKPGKTVPLFFVAANTSPDINDKLVSITSDVGTVALTGDGSVPAGRALVAGAKKQAVPMGSVTPATAEVTLSKPITNGPTYNFTFNFEKAGPTTVAVPLSAGENPRR